jgi:RND family efflux transporter MFP subunit
VSQVAIDDARTQAGLAEVAVRDAERALRNATLTAPFEALVASRNTDLYATLAPGAPVARLHDMSEIRVEIDVPEILFQRSAGEPDLTLTASFPAQEAAFPLEIREYNAETSSVGQTFRLTLGMEAPEGLSVLPGSSVTVTARIGGRAPGLDVPASAITADPDGTLYVLVFEPAGAQVGTLARREVTVMATADGGFRVTAGLQPGEEIVAAGPAVLEPGMRVRRFEGFGQ